MREWVKNIYAMQNICKLGCSNRLSTPTFEKVLKTLTWQAGVTLKTSQQSKSWSKLSMLHITAALKLSVAISARGKQDTESPQHGYSTSGWRVFWSRGIPQRIRPLSEVYKWGALFTLGGWAVATSCRVRSFHTAFSPDIKSQAPSLGYAVICGSLSSPGFCLRSFSWGHSFRCSDLCDSSLAQSLEFSKRWHYSSTVKNNNKTTCSRDHLSQGSDTKDD